MHDVAPAVYLCDDMRDVNVKMVCDFTHHECDETNNSDMLNM